MTAPVDTKQSYQCTCFSKTILYSIRHSFRSVPGTSSIFQSMARISWLWQTQAMDTVMLKILSCTYGKRESSKNFNAFQPTPLKTHYFTINTRKFLTFSNSKYDNHKISVYEWKNEALSSKTQDIQIKYPNRCNTFLIHNITYIACGEADISDTVSVLKWSGKQFHSFQDLSLSIVRCRPHLIHANGTIYLAIANYKKSGNNGNFDIDSFIYRWNGTKLVHYQSIPTHGAMDLDSFTTPSGEVFLVVANSYTEKGAKFNVKSAVYKLVDIKFNLYQQLPSAEAYYVHAFTHKGKQYLVVVNKHDGRIFNIDSPVYIWN